MSFQTKNMNINKENIDELLFDYFEGQLTPTQGDALMGFIHLHPEHESDFMQWKKAYHHKEHVIEDYGIAESIKVPVAALPSFKPYFFGALLGLGFALGFVTSWVAGRFNNEPIVISEKFDSPKLGIKPREKGVNTVQVLNSNKSNKPQKAFTVVEEKPNVAQEVVAIQENEYATIETKVVEKVETPIEVNDSPKPLEMKDSSKVVAETELPNTIEQKPVQEKKKSKKRRSGMYSTTDKLLPINHNF